MPVDSSHSSWLSSSAEKQTESSGSGFFVDDEGTILTNAHVVATSSDSPVSVTTADGLKYPAFIHAVDPYSDLAIIKLLNPEKTKFDPVVFGENSDLRAGDWV